MLSVRGHFSDLAVVGRIILKLILIELRVGPGFIWLRMSDGLL
jgi:hypothetical protein